MKGILIFLGLLVIAGLLLLTRYESLAAPVIQKVAEQEKGKEAMLEALRADEKAFRAKHQPLLDRRWQVAQGALAFDEAYFMRLAAETLELYRDTPFEEMVPYDRFMYAYAKRLEQMPSVQHQEQAYLLYRSYVTAFPRGEKAGLAQNAINRLVNKYGFR